MTNEPFKGLQIAKAMPVGTQTIQDVIITITADKKGMDENQTLADWNAFAEEQATALFTALRYSLPGGTYDRLLAKMMTERASSFKVLL